MIQISTVYFRNRIEILAISNVQISLFRLGQFLWIINSSKMKLCIFKIDRFFKYQQFWKVYLDLGTWNVCKHVLQK